MIIRCWGNFFILQTAGEIDEEFKARNHGDSFCISEF